MNGRVIAAVGAGVLLVAGGVWVARNQPAPHDATEPIPAHIAPDDLAGQACDYVTQKLPRQIADDAPADEVRADLRHARSLAETAADRSTAWVPLASGVTTLQRAVEADDPGAALLAIKVVTAQCPRS